MNPQRPRTIYEPTQSTVLKLLTPSFLLAQRAETFCCRTQTNSVDVKRLLALEHLLDGLSGVRLGPLKGHTESSVPDELRNNTKGTGDTEEDGVEVLLVETVVSKEDTRVGVDVGPGVLGLTGLEENVRDDLVDLTDKLEERVLGQVLEGELSLSSVSGVSLPKDGVAVTGNDLARLEGRPDVLGDLLVRSFFTDLRSHLLDPSEDFLVSETMEGTGETVQGSTEGKEGVRESGTDQVTGVSGNVTTLVVRVDGDVQPHELDKVSVVTETEQGSQVGRVVLAGVNGRELAVTEDVSEDSASNVGELGNEVHGVIEGGLPVLLLVDTVRVGLGEGRVVVKGVNGDGELGHGVESVRASVDQFLNELGDGSPGSPFLRKTLDLLVGRDLTSQEQPEKGLRQGLGTSGSRGELLLTLGNSQATESNTLVGVEDGTLPYKALDASHTTVSHVDGDIAEGLSAVGGTSSLDVFNLLGDELGHAVLEGLSVGGRGGSEGPREGGTQLGPEGVSAGNEAHFVLWM